MIKTSMRPISMLPVVSFVLGLAGSAIETAARK
jgi:hypothetical protein